MASTNSSNDVPPTHVKFSQLVRDDTLLKPRLDDDVLVRDVRTVQEAYLKAVQEIYKDVSEAVGNIQDPLESDRMGGLHGEASGEFEVDELLEDLSGEALQLEPQGTMQDFIVQTIDEDDIPDPYFVAFAERRPFYGLQSVAGQEDNNLRHLEVQREMKDIKKQLDKARADGDEKRAAELEDIFESMKADFRIGEPAPLTSATEPKTAERQQDAPPEKVPGRE